MLVIMGVDPVAEEEDTGNWCGGGRNGAWMNRSGSRSEAGVERYPHLLSVRAGRSGRSVIQKFPPRERTYIDWESPRFTEETGQGYIVQ